MVNVAVLGATGYTGLELIKILLRHPGVEVTALTSRQEDEPHIQEVHPRLYGQLDLKCENLTAEQLASRAEYIFSALPHGVSMQTVPELLSLGCRVIDLSADYRLSDPAVYEQWYGQVHTDPTRLGSTVYGLPELGSEKISGHELIANPGCYTSCSILSLAPLLAQGIIQSDGIIIDAKSGISGAGRSTKLNSLFAERDQDVAAYAIGTHRHTPEIDLLLSQVAGQNIEVIFTPHLVPMDRGILCTSYTKLVQQMSRTEILTQIRQFYAQSPFIRVVEHLPSTKETLGTNFCDISVQFSRNHLVVLACLDNLVKGAAGVAVQNFNLLAGFEETTALLP